MLNNYIWHHDPTINDIHKESLGMIFLLPTIINDVFCQYFE